MWLTWWIFTERGIFPAKKLPKTDPALTAQPQRRGVDLTREERSGSSLNCCNWAPTSRPAAPRSARTNLTLWFMLAVFSTLPIIFLERSLVWDVSDWQALPANARCCFASCANKNALFIKTVRAGKCEIFCCSLLYWLYINMILLAFVREIII